MTSSLLSAVLLTSSPDTDRPPVVANMTSSQASLNYANEIWEGGQKRDDLFFHPIYATSKVGLTGVTMHMARDLRVRHVYMIVIGVTGLDEQDQAIVGAIHP